MERFGFYEHCEDQRKYKRNKKVAHEQLEMSKGFVDMVTDKQIWG